MYTKSLYLLELLNTSSMHLLNICVLYFSLIVIKKNGYFILVIFFFFKMSSDFHLMFVQDAQINA